MFENITKIDIAYENYKIIKNSDNPKFAKLDRWLLKESNIFKKECRYTKKQYQKYDRGTIIKADFGINIGAEISNIHFAIVLSKNDNTRNPVVYVLPLTSNCDKRNYPLNNLIVVELLKRLEKYTNKVQMEIKNSKNNKYIHENFIDEKERELFEMKEIIGNYIKDMTNSYACFNQIRVISKDRILKPKNKLDIIGRAKCSRKVLNEIDKLIITNLTDIYLN